LAKVLDVDVGDIKFCCRLRDGGSSQNYNEGKDSD